MDDDRCTESDGDAKKNICFHLSLLAHCCTLVPLTKTVLDLTIIVYLVWLEPSYDVARLS